jgi:hypothetical protein
VVAASSLGLLKLDTTSDKMVAVGVFSIVMAGWWLGGVRLLPKGRALARLAHGRRYSTTPCSTPARSASEGNSFAVPRLRFGLVLDRAQSGLANCSSILTTRSLTATAPAGSLDAATKLLPRQPKEKPP